MNEKITIDIEANLSNLSEAKREIKAISEDLGSAGTNFGRLLTESLQRTGSVADTLEKRIKRIDGNTFKSDDERSAFISGTRDTIKELESMLALQRGNSDFGVRLASSWFSGLPGAIQKQFDAMIPRLNNILRTKMSSLYDGIDAITESSHEGIVHQLKRTPFVKKAEATISPTHKADFDRFLRHYISNAVAPNRLDGYHVARYGHNADKNARVERLGLNQIIPSSYLDSVRAGRYTKLDLSDQSGKVLDASSRRRLSELMGSNPILVQAAISSGISHRDKRGILKTKTQITPDDYNSIREALYNEMVVRGSGSRAAARGGWFDFEGADAEKVSKRLTSSSGAKTILAMKALDSIVGTGSWTEASGRQSYTTQKHEPKRLLDSYLTKKYSPFLGASDSLSFDRPRDIKIDESQFTHFLGRGRLRNLDDISYGYRTISLDGYDKTNPVHSDGLRRILRDGVMLDGKKFVHVATHGTGENTTLRLVAQEEKDRIEAEEREWAKSVGFNGDYFANFVQSPNSLDRKTWSKLQDASNKKFSPGYRTGINLDGKRIALVDIGDEGDGAGWMPSSMISSSFQGRLGVAGKGSVFMINAANMREFGAKTGALDENGRWMVRGLNGDIDLAEYDAAIPLHMIKNRNAYTNADGSFVSSEKANEMFLEDLKRHGVYTLADYDSESTSSDVLGSQMTAFMKFSPELMLHQAEQAAKRFRELETETGMLKYVFADPEGDYLSAAVRENPQLLQTPEARKRVDYYRESLQRKLAQGEYIDFGDSDSSISNIRAAASPLESLLMGTTGEISASVLARARTVLENNVKDKTFTDEEIKNLIVLQKGTAIDFAHEDEDQLGILRSPTGYGNMVYADNLAKYAKYLYDEFGISKTGAYVSKHNLPDLQGADYDGDRFKVVTGELATVVRDTLVDVENALKNATPDDLDIKLSPSSSEDSSIDEAERTAQYAERSVDSVLKMGSGSAISLRGRMVDTTRREYQPYVYAMKRGEKYYDYGTTYSKDPKDATVDQQMWNVQNLGKHFSSFVDHSEDLFSFDDDMLDSQGKVISEHPDVFRSSSGRLVNMRRLRDMQLHKINLPSVNMESDLLGVAAASALYNNGIDTSGWDAILEAYGRISKNGAGAKASQAMDTSVKLLTEFATGARTKIEQDEVSAIKTLLAEADDEFSNEAVANGWLDVNSGVINYGGRTYKTRAGYLKARRREHGLHILDQAVNNFGFTDDLLQGAIGTERAGFYKNNPSIERVLRAPSSKPVTANPVVEKQPPQPNSQDQPQVEVNISPIELSQDSPIRQSFENELLAAGATEEVIAKTLQGLTEKDIANRVVDEANKSTHYLNKIKFRQEQTHAEKFFGLERWRVSHIREMYNEARRTLSPDVFGDGTPLHNQALFAIAEQNRAHLEGTHNWADRFTSSLLDDMKKNETRADDSFEKHAARISRYATQLNEARSVRKQYVEDRKFMGVAADQDFVDALDARIAEMSALSDGRLRNGYKSVNRRQFINNTRYGRYLKQTEDELEQRRLLDEAYHAQKETLETNRSSLPIDTDEYVKASKTIDELSKAIDRNKKAMDGLNGSAGMMTAGLRMAEDAAVRLITRFGQQLMAKAWNELKQFTLEFNSAMTEIQMVTLKSDKEMAAVRANTLKDAVRYRTSVSNVASVRTDLYRQGLSDAEVDERSGSILKFAKVAAINTESATKIVTTALQNNLVSSAEHAMDVLVALGDNAATTAEEVANAMQKCAAAAKVAGVSYEQLTPMLATMTSMTQLSGKQVGTAMNTILTRLHNVTATKYAKDVNGEITSLNDVEAALKTVGISLRTDGGDWRNSYDVLADIAERWQTMSDIQKSLVSTSVAGTRQGNMFQTLMEGMSEDGGETFRKYRELAENSDGITDEKYAIGVQSLASSLETLEASFDRLVSSIESSGVAQWFLDFISNTLNGISSLIERIPALGYTLAALIPILGAIAGIVVAINVSKYNAIAGLAAGIATAGAVAIAVGGIGNAEASLASGSSPSSRRQQDAAAERAAKRVSKRDSINSLIEETRSLGKAYDMLGDEMNKVDSSKLENNLRTLMLMFPNLAEGVNGSSTAIENWSDIVDQAAEASARLEKSERDRLIASGLSYVGSNAQSIIDEKMGELNQGNTGFTDDTIPTLNSAITGVSYETALEYGYSNAPRYFADGSIPDDNEERIRTESKFTASQYKAFINSLDENKYNEYYRTKAIEFINNLDLDDDVTYTNSDLALDPVLFPDYSIPDIEINLGPMAHNKIQKTPGSLHGDVAKESLLSYIKKTNYYAKAKDFANDQHGNVLYDAYAAYIPEEYKNMYKINPETLVEMPAFDSAKTIEFILRGGYKNALEDNNESHFESFLREVFRYRVFDNVEGLDDALISSEEAFVGALKTGSAEVDGKTYKFTEKALAAISEIIFDMLSDENSYPALLASAKKDAENSALNAIIDEAINMAFGEAIGDDPLLMKTIRNNFIESLNTNGYVDENGRLMYDAAWVEPGQLQKRLTLAYDKTGYDKGNTQYNLRPEDYPYVWDGKGYATKEAVEEAITNAANEKGHNDEWIRQQKKSVTTGGSNAGLPAFPSIQQIIDSAYLKYQTENKSYIPQYQELLAIHGQYKTMDDFSNAVPDNMPLQEMLANNSQLLLAWQSAANGGMFTYDMLGNVLQGAAYGQNALGHNDYMSMMSYAFGEDFESQFATGKYDTSNPDNIARFQKAMQDDAFVSYLDTLKSEYEGLDEVIEALTEGTKLTEERQKSLAGVLESRAYSAANKYAKSVGLVAEHLDEVAKGGDSATAAIKKVNSMSQTRNDVRRSLNAFKGKTATAEDMSTLADFFGFSEDQIYKEYERLGQGGAEEFVNGMENGLTEYEDTLTDVFNKTVADPINAALTNPNIPSINLADYVYADGTVDVSALIAQLNAVGAKIQNTAAQYACALTLSADGEKVEVKFEQKPRSVGGRGGGGGGGKQKSVAERLIESRERALVQRDHILNMIEYSRSYYDNRGEYGNVNKMISAENKALYAKRGALTTTVKNLREQMKKEKQGSEDWLALQEALFKAEEAIQDINNTIDENNRTLKENKEAIRQTRIELEDLIDNEIKNRLSLEQSMLDGTVSMQETVLEAIKQRYQDEWDLVKKDIEKKKEALEEEKQLIDDRLNARKDAADEAEKYEQLAEYKQQLAMISMDSTRTKDAAELRKKAADLEKEIAQDIAEDEANAMKDRLDDETSAYDDFLAMGDESMQAFLENANNFADEVKEVMRLSHDDLMAWLTLNVQAYTNSLEDAKEQMLRTWEDMYDQMFGITDTFWEEIDDILEDKNTFLNYMMNSEEYQNASETEQASLRYEWGRLYDSMVNASKNDAQFNHEDNLPYKGSKSVVVTTKSAPVVSTPTVTSVSDISAILDLPDPEKHKIQGYDKGGLVDYTGLAVVHGTPAEPEAFISSNDRVLIRSMIDAMNFVKYLPTVHNVNMEHSNRQGTNISELNITIQQADLSSDEKIEDVARKIGEAFTKELSKSGVGTTNISF